MCACVYPHVCMCMCMHDRCAWLQTGRKQRNFKSLSILYKLRLKSSNMASNTQNAGWSIVYIMLINFIVDLEMTGMDEVMFRTPHPLKFSPKVLCCQIYFGRLRFI